MPTNTKLGPDSLAERFHEAVRRPNDRKIGLEIERIGLFEDGTAFQYIGKKGHQGAGDLLPVLASRYGWNLVSNSEGAPLGMSGPLGKVSLEPGSQLELSAHPEASLIELAHIIDGFERQVDEVSHDWGLRWICIGVNPIHPVESLDVIPSTRYHIMTDYLGKRARLGTSMMRLTSSVQVNLDYTSEAEAIEMLRVALAAAPVSYALFSNSPLLNRKPTGWLSFRQQIWRETDPDRTGLLPEAFAKGFDFAAYAQLAWKRPLMFAQDPAGKYVPAEGKSLADIATGKLPGVTITEANLTNSVQELFFEARLKPGYVEIRSLDGQCPGDRYAATAFWTGLLYRPEARRLALDLLGGMDAAARDRLFEKAAKVGLAATEGTVNLHDVSRRLVEAARETLVQRKLGEEKLIQSAFRSIDDGRNPAQRRLALFEKRGSPTDPASLVSIASPV